MGQNKSKQTKTEIFARKSIEKHTENKSSERKNFGGETKKETVEQFLYELSYDSLTNSKIARPH